MSCCFVVGVFTIAGETYIGALTLQVSMMRQPVKQKDAKPSLQTFEPGFRIFLCDF
jgi:hypothetical protein